MKPSKGEVLLTRLYTYALNGIPKVSEPLDTLVNSYLYKSSNPEEAIDDFIRTQKLKCATTGFMTGLGGLMTLPVTLPADMVSSLFIEMRLIAGIAMMRGYNLNDDKVKTTVYLCLVYNSIGDIVKKVGIEIVENITIKKLLPKLSREILKAINHQVGFKMIAKGGVKAPIKVGKMVPVIGGLIGAGWNWLEVSAYAGYAKKMFVIKPI
ncbi:MAG: EcsC family protein [Duncaniella sp.]|nr:EcsC family protein [Duncaniella sp.]